MNFLEIEIYIFIILIFQLQNKSFFKIEFLTIQ